MQSGPDDQSMLALSSRPQHNSGGVAASALAKRGGAPPRPLLAATVTEATTAIEMPPAEEAETNEFSSKRPLEAHAAEGRWAVSTPSSATLPQSFADVAPLPTPQRHGSLPLHPESFLETPTRRIVWRRLRVLVMLLLLQSLSQVVLQAFEGLIAANIAVPLFLTMLVGAGGNAGNQAAVTAITGLTSGELTRWDAMKVVSKEAIVGLLCAAALGVMGFIRVLIFYAGEDDAATAPVFATVFAISLSLFFIVLSSVVLGGALPFALRRVGANVEHAAPMIQVVMDILGVTICCVVCSAFLPTAVTTSQSPPPAGGVPVTAPDVGNADAPEVLVGDK